ncbi:hypothetical protein [Zwartia sp.]|uniref:hypothetical protein n=1 Tax=Zwartia sp. TaxID=2978004 RepID=UPI002720FAC5|nr:hypothetical protein [Zwartia sp.]MDO9025904.1 hypothetical protein [Zwartia sp.]
MKALIVSLCQTAVCNRHHSIDQLEALSCECYSAVKKETDLLLNYLPQRSIIKDPETIPTTAIKAP